MGLLRRLAGLLPRPCLLGDRGPRNNNNTNNKDNNSNDNNSNLYQ